MSAKKKDQKVLDGRSLDEIFAKLNKMAENREQTQPDVYLRTETVERKNLECLCGGVSKTYVKNGPGAKQLAVCPSCNPRNHCIKCQGSGHVRKFNILTLREDLIPFGCECTTLEKRVELLNAAKIPAKYLTVELNILEIEHLSPELKTKYIAAQKAIYEFCDHSDRALREGREIDDKYFLILMGPVGTGKTHLGIAALRRLIAHHGHPGRFIDFLDLLNTLRDSYSVKTSEGEIMGPLRETPILMIDEFGKGRAESEWQLEKLDDLVNSRYNSGKVTIVTTNYLTPKLYNEWRRGLSADSRMSMERRSVDFRRTNAVSAVNENQRDSSANIVTGETFWVQDLRERIGHRMYDRIVEAGLFVDFVGIPSFRRRAENNFLAAYLNEDDDT